MAEMTTTRVVTNGSSQSVTIPEEFRFETDEVGIRRDPATGDIILSPAPVGRSDSRPTWEEIFAALDAAPPPDGFMDDRDQGIPDHRPFL